MEFVMHLITIPALQEDNMDARTPQEKYEAARAANDADSAREILSELWGGGILAEAQADDYLCTDGGLLWYNGEAKGWEASCVRVPEFPPVDELTGELLKIRAHDHGFVGFSVSIRISNLQAGAMEKSIMELYQGRGLGVDETLFVWTSSDHNVDNLEHAVELALNEFRARRRSGMRLNNWETRHENRGVGGGH